MTGAPVAAIDCGTNSTRLLVLDSDGRRLDRRMQITRLGEGVDRTGELTPQAIERTLRVLSEYRGVIDALGVPLGSVRTTATSAARDASNAVAFLEPAEAILGSPPEVIEGGEEGRLSWIGATATLPAMATGDAPGRVLVVDVGGGSTELIAGRSDSSTPDAVVSMDIGCVRVTERYLAADPPGPRAIAEARAAVRDTVEAVLAETPSFRGCDLLVGLAGTVSALTVLALGLPGYDEQRVHHAHVSIARAAEWRDRLGSVSLAERRLIPGMEVERADVIVGGAIVLCEVMDACGAGELVASEADILDGIALGILAGRRAG